MSAVALCGATDCGGAACAEPAGHETPHVVRIVVGPGLPGLRFWFGDHRNPKHDCACRVESTVLPRLVRCLRCGDVVEPGLDTFVACGCGRVKASRSVGWGSLGVIGDRSDWEYLRPRAQA